MSTKSAWVCTALLAPMGVGVEVPSDSLPGASRVTTIRGAAGGGVYGRDVYVSFGFVEDCGGSYELTGDYYLRNEYVDVGAEVDTDVDGTLHVGVRGGFIRDESANQSALPIDPFTGDVVALPEDADGITDTYYGNPFISIERRTVGLGIGLLFSSAPLKTGDREEVPLDDDLDATASGHIRLGTEQVHVLYRLWEGVPIYSDGGQHVFGLGSDVRPLHVFIGGATGGPHGGSETTFFTTLGVDLTRHVRLTATYRFPSTFSYSDSLGSYQFDEWGVSAGLVYSFYRD